MVKGIETKIPSTAGLNNESQYDTDKRNLEKNTEDVNSKYLILVLSKKKTILMSKSQKLKMNT